MIMTGEQTVFIVDDDPAVRDALSTLLDSVNLPSRVFSRARDLLDEINEQSRGCLVLDIRMPSMSGLELQTKLHARGVALPIIFITGHGDINMAVKAMRLGALDFITKPYSEQMLLDRIHEALVFEKNQRQLFFNGNELLTRIDKLSPREHEVFKRVAKGQSNKAMAYDLGLSERTIEVHRSNMMKKMQADTLAEIVRMSLEADRYKFLNGSGLGANLQRSS
jgi:two-component system, LuxR family, response regulator FixJ